jgi:hypothetical protein
MHHLPGAGGADGAAFLGSFGHPSTMLRYEVPMEERAQ